MSLTAILDSTEGLDPAVAALYSERNGKFELTGITGIKTQADVDRLSAAAAKERDDHRTTREKLTAFGDLVPTDVRAQLDKIEEYKLAAEGKLDDEAIEKVVTARLKSATSPLERQVQELTGLRETDAQELATLRAEKTQRIVHDKVRKAAIADKVIDTAMDDVLMLADRVFEILEDGRVVTKDGVGVTPGIEADIWLKDMAQTRPHWWPASQGGGAGGGRGQGGGGKNPWAAGTWNMTEQGAYIREHGMDKATQMAAQAGTTIGGKAATK